MATDMIAPKYPRYVADLLACMADETRNVEISDSGQTGATVFCLGNRWMVVQCFANNAVIWADNIALVTLDEEADPERLTAAALATDFEGEPLWLIDVKRLDELGSYGESLKVLWRSDRTGE
jgi:hypothetical protein